MTDKQDVLVEALRAIKDWCDESLCPVDDPSVGIHGRPECPLCEATELPHGEDCPYPKIEAALATIKNP